MEVENRLRISNASPVVRLFQNKVVFLMLIYDKPLLSGQPPVSSHLPVYPEGSSVSHGNNKNVKA